MSPVISGSVVVDARLDYQGTHLAETAAERQDIATEPFDPQEWCDDPERVVGWRVDTDGHTDPVTQFGVIKVGTVRRAPIVHRKPCPRRGGGFPRHAHRTLRARLALTGQGVTR